MENLFTLDLPDPSRHAIALSSRVTVVVLVVADHHVMLGLFVDGRFVHSLAGAVGVA